MRKKVIVMATFVLVFFTTLFILLPKSNDPTNSTSEQTQPTQIPENLDYEKVCLISKSYVPYQVVYLIDSKDTKHKVSLTSQGTIVKVVNDTYSYEYVHQYLNKLDSESDELISTMTDRIEGTLDEIKSSLNGVIYTKASSSIIFGMNIEDIVDTYHFENVGNMILMTGTLKTSVISTLIPNVNKDIVFNYSLKVDRDFTKYIQFNINYSTSTFDEISIIINYD